MARIVITISDDEDDDGRVCVTTDFDPPVQRDEELTPAQRVGLDLLMSATGTAASEDPDFTFNAEET